MNESLDLSELEESSIQEHRCEFCAYRTTNKSNYNRHKRRHTSSQPATSTPLRHDAPVPTSPKQKQMCDQCGKAYDTKFGLTLHKKNKHEHSFKHICQMCNKGFNQTIQYRFHCANLLNVAFEKCTFCKTEFTSPGCLRRHLRICKDNPEHEQENAYQCSVCSSSFPTKHGLKYHMKGKHQPPRYRCSKCGNRFAWRSSLRAHKKTCSFRLGLMFFQNNYIL